MIIIIRETHFRVTELSHYHRLIGVSDQGLRETFFMCLSGRDESAHSYETVTQVEGKRAGLERGACLQSNPECNIAFPI